MKYLVRYDSEISAGCYVFDDLSEAIKTYREHRYSKHHISARLIDVSEHPDITILSHRHINPNPFYRCNNK